MSAEALLRMGGPLLLAAATAWLLDRLCVKKGLQPPAFRVPWRRAAAGATVAAILWRGVFAPLGAIGLGVEADLSSLSTPELFLLHGLLVLTMLAWFLLGFAGAAGRPAAVAVEAPSAASGSAGEGAEWTPYTLPESSSGPPAPAPAAAPPARLSLGRQLLAQFGLVAPSVPREIGLGLVLGVGAWLAVLGVLLVIGLAIVALGGEKALPKAPPTLVPFLAGLPLGVRLLVSLSAGFVEESFFRGFLQPRIGIALSTLLFAMAHLSYGQPLMLVGIGVLSLIYALIVRWRQTIWPAVAAHALFDAVQLLVMIPFALRFLERAGAKTAAFFSMGIW